MTATAQTNPTKWNRYDYTGSDPANNVDPAGTEFCPAQFGGEVCGHLDGLPSLDPAAQCIEQAMFVGVSGVPGLQQTNPCLSVSTVLLLAAAQSVPKKEEKQEQYCFAQLKFRPVDDLAARLIGANHSFWWMRDRDGNRYIISGGPNPTTSGSKLQVWTVAGDYNGADTKDQKVAYDSGTSLDHCYQVDALFGAAYGFPKGSINYDWAGPNSNSAARYLGSRAGFQPGRPEGAIGWGAKIPGLEP